MPPQQRHRDPRELHSRYDQVKDGFRDSNRNVTSMLRDRENEFMQNHQRVLRKLEDQMRETDRQRSIQQMMLKKHYEHQKRIMRQRHEELMQVRDRLVRIKQHEKHQLGRERDIHQMQYRLEQQQNAFESRKSKVLSEREMLEQQKLSMMKELEEFDKLTKDMSKLNLWSTDLTEEQKTEMDRFVASHPEVGQVTQAAEDMEYNQHIPAAPTPRYRDYRPSGPRTPFEMGLDADFESSSQYTFDPRKSHRKSRRQSGFSTMSTMTVEPEPTLNRRKSQKNSKKKTKQKNTTKSTKTKSGNLYIRLVDARDVFGADGNAPNTYVQLELDHQIQKSSVSDYTHDPYWNEVFQFRVRDYNSEKLTLRLIDAFNQRTLAKMKIPCSHFVQKKEEKRPRRKSTINLEFENEFTGFRDMDVFDGYESMDEVSTKSRKKKKSTEKSKKKKKKWGILRSLVEGSPSKKKSKSKK